MAVSNKITRKPGLTAHQVVEDLIQDCRAIVDYYVDNTKLPGDGRTVIRNAMYARINRLTFCGFGKRVPFKWLGVRK